MTLYKLDAGNARRLLASLGIVPTVDFLSLRSAQVNQLVEYARSTGYHKPRGGSSMGRCFHTYLCRRAGAPR
jgi:hypothetical protein